MQKKAGLFLASILVTMMLLFAPQNGEAAIVRQYPEFGANELGIILDDFMLKTPFNPGKYYTIDNKEKTGNTVIYTVAQEKSMYYSKIFKVSVDSRTNLITGIDFQFYLKNARYNWYKSTYDSWGSAVKQRYGDPTEEGGSDTDPYGNFYENGKYKYLMFSKCSSNPLASNIVPEYGLFRVTISAL